LKKVTKGFIAGLKAKKSRYDLYDDCLHTWVTPKGRIGFAFATKVNGKRVRYPIATFPNNCLDDYQREEVQRRYADLYIEHTNSIPTEVIQHRQLHHSNKLVINLFEAFIEEHCPTLRPSSADRYIRILRNTFREMHSIRVSELSKRHLLEARERLLDRPGMLVSSMSVLRSVLNWGERHEWIAESPWQNMPASKKPNRNRVLTPEEILAVWDYMNRVLRFLLLSGQRVGEVLMLQWKDLEISTPEQEYSELYADGGPVIRYPPVRWTQPDHKTGKPHVLPLPAFAVEQLPHYFDGGNAVLGGTGAVFTSPRTLKGYASTNAVLLMLSRQVFSKTAVEHFTVHDLRRTALTNIARLMQSGEAAERVANHALNDVASRYNLYSFEDLKGRALMRWSAYVKHLTSGGKFDADGLPLPGGTDPQSGEPLQWHDIHEHGKAGDPWEVV